MKHRLNSWKPVTDQDVGNHERIPTKDRRERAETNCRLQAESKQAGTRPVQDIVRSARKLVAAKTCSICGKTKPVSEFYKKGSQCKVCLIQKSIAYGKTAIGREVARRTRESYKERHYDDLMASKRKYKLSDKGRASERRYRKNALKRTPDKIRARVLVNTHVLKGKLTKPKQCARCGIKARTQAHHTDYKKPLVVEWLCHACHKLADLEVAIQIERLENFEFQKKLTKEQLMKLAPKDGDISAADWLKPYNYEELFAPKSPEELRKLIGQAPPVGADREASEDELPFDPDDADAPLEEEEIESIEDLL